LCDLFVAAYFRSAEKYRAIEATVPTPNRFRLRYHRQIHDAVRSIVQSLPRATAPAIAEWASTITAEDRDEFSAAVQAELTLVNEGTFAGYGLRPSEFACWEQAKLK
jgi:hypothetical protein